MCLCDLWNVKEPRQEMQWMTLKFVQKLFSMISIQYYIDIMHKFRKYIGIETWNTYEVLHFLCWKTYYHWIIIIFYVILQNQRKDLCRPHRWSFISFSCWRKYTRIASILCIVWKWQQKDHTWQLTNSSKVKTKPGFKLVHVSYS